MAAPLLLSHVSLFTCTMCFHGGGDSRGGEEHSEIEDDPPPFLSPRCQDHSTSGAQHTAPDEHQLQPDGFVESTLRSYHATPVSGQTNEPEDFITGLLNKVKK